VAIRTLVVDDSALMRKLIKDILSSDPAINVIDTAHDGKDAVEKTQRLKPDVITMDVEMPVMNGIDAVKHIMGTNPTPIVMLSALTSKGAETTIDALEAGAIDFICKPSGSISTDIKIIGEEIVQKVKSAAIANMKPEKVTVTNQPSTQIQRSKIKTLLVDDSPFFIKTTTDILQKYPDIEIIGTAENGKQAIEKFHELQPDVIVMDIEMPEMNGVETTHALLKEQFVPIIVFSSKTSEDMKDVKLALERGAVDFIAKPSKETSLHSLSQLLVQKIRDACEQKQIHRITSLSDKILVIGTSTGGPQTLTELIPNLPADIPAGVLIVQHMPPVFTKSLADRLDRKSQIRVKEAEEGDEISPGRAFIAPGDYHMTIKEKTSNGVTKKFISLNQDQKIHGVRPAVDVTFSSAANIYGPGTVAVLLTGMGQDGANAMGLVKAKGGYTIAQDEKTSIIFGMPQVAIKLGVVEKVLPLNMIPSEIIKRLIKGKDG